MDFRKDESIEWDKVKMIVIDTDHTGDQESEFMKFLIAKDWKGIMCFDDIKLKSNGQIKKSSCNSTLSKYRFYERTFGRR